MPNRKQTQVAEALAHLAADFFARESNRESLITVTRADVSPDLKNVKIFFSVLPEKLEAKALAFAKRERSAFRLYVRNNSPFHHAPTVDFEIDYGEKNRLRIEDLTRT